jgi:serine-type D-Ala-D-Ala carboxypeptidase (penicillin-binding protein 5/6)
MTMTTLPPVYMTPEESRRRRETARRRRRARRRATATGVLALAIVAALVVMALAHAHSHGSASVSSQRGHRGTHRNGHTIGSATTATDAPTRSPIGLPLGRPPLVLAGIGAAERNPVQIDFHHPPRAGLLFNLSTGQVLWQHNPHERLRIASLTKMMTALLTVRSAPPNAPVLVTREAVKSAGSKVGVLPLGHHVRVETMLYGLMLPSGNDAAIALAQHVSGSITGFVARMNAEAAHLGMGCTHYSSPSGYVDQYNFSCAADLAVLAHVDLGQPRIARIAHTYTAKLRFPIKGGYVYLYNNNPLLIYHYPGLTGLKTGYTLAAGRCLVATAERHGVRLGVVLLSSLNPGTQARQLLDRGFEDVYHQPQVSAPPIPPGE